MSDMSYRFSPDDLRLRTAIGIREPTVIRIPSANGTALYGPYLDLLAGRYEAVIRFDPDIACRGRAIMDVCAGVGTERLAWQSISADQILADDMSARLVSASYLSRLAANWPNPYLPNPYPPSPHLNC